MLLVDGQYRDPVFTNGPVPLWTTVPEWIRPGNIIYTLTAVDRDVCPVVYRVESEAGESEQELPVGILSPDGWFLKNLYR